MIPPELLSVGSAASHLAAHFGYCVIPTSPVDYISDYHMIKSISIGSPKHNGSVFSKLAVRQEGLLSICGVREGDLAQIILAAEVKVQFIYTRFDAAPNLEIVRYILKSVRRQEDLDELSSRFLGLALQCGCVEIAAYICIPRVLSAAIPESTRSLVFMSRLGVVDMALVMSLIRHGIALKHPVHSQPFLIILLNLSRYHPRVLRSIVDQSFLRYPDYGRTVLFNERCRIVAYIIKNGDIRTLKYIVNQFDLNRLNFDHSSCIRLALVHDRIAIALYLIKTFGWPRTTDPAVSEKLDRLKFAAPSDTTSSTSDPI